MITFALVGNQNCGKTTLFNQLTGSSQHVGNFPGVTVERKEGFVRKQKEVVVVDLPGIYSLSPYTKDEILTRDFIIRGHSQGIINIVDATNIERNLYLTLQLLQFGIPMVIALNMMDEITANNGTIFIEEMQRQLGVSVVPISAVKNMGIEKLISIALEVSVKKQIPVKKNYYTGSCANTLKDIAKMLERSADKVHINANFAAVKLLENDTAILSELNIGEELKRNIERKIRSMENELLTDRKAAVADMRYRFIDSLCTAAVKKPKESSQHKRSIRIDNLLVNKYLAIPVFLGIMFLIFWLTFSLIGSFLSDILGRIIWCFTDYLKSLLITAGAADIVVSMVTDGIIAGVGSVLSFIPTITVLFLFLSLLEDSGYMARVAFIMDKPLRIIGLSGRSFVPMIVGFGCSVPAVMATRTLQSERERKMAIFSIPFMSCSAKLPIYGMFTMAFFSKNRALVMISLYIIGIGLGIVSNLFVKKYLYPGEADRFVLELPNYRLPGAKSVLLLLWDKVKDFLTRAFTIIFTAAIVIWFLQKFNWQLKPVSNTSESILSGIGHLAMPIFRPLGFDDWRVTTALITGFMAKEAVVSTFSVLTGGTASLKLSIALNQIMTPLAAYSFLIFTLLYTPCIAAISIINRELNTRAAIWVAVYQTAVAWGCAMIIYQLGSLFI